MTHEECKAAILAREAVRDAAHPSTEHELRQQLADVSNERDELRKQREAILMQARVWAGEAKTQRSTVESVGSILGGLPDWGPIAAGVEALRDRLNASEVRNAEAERLLSDAGLLLALLYPEQADMDKWREGVNKWFAQSAPATDEQGAGA